MADDHTLRLEREHVRSQLLNGRRLSDLHEVIDGEAWRTIQDLREAQTRARRLESERDLLVDLVVVAVEHLLPIGAYGGANQVVQQLERSLESLGLQRKAPDGG